MHVTVHYMAQLKRAAGVSSESVEVVGECTVASLLARLAQGREEAFAGLVLTDQGQPRPSLLVFVGTEQVPGAWRVRDGDEITLLTPMSGG